MENILTEKQQNILKVADCCSNLYGVYSMTQLIKVYNEFNKDKITKDEVYHLCDIDEHEDFSETIFYTDCLAHKSIADDDIDKIIKAQRGSNFYMPKTNKELLSYNTRLFIEPNKEYEEFVAFNGAYLKISVGKGLTTFDKIIEMINRYLRWECYD